ncbi:MAG: hypothetical protein Q8M07_30675 [Prosthecobacter sp.]|nr:hypothetical protein [Prosthecobacter sp.]
MILLRVLFFKHGFAIYDSERCHFDDADWQTYEALDAPVAP